MSINLMQGALAAVLLQQRKVAGSKLAAGAAFAAVMPGLPGLLLPVVMAQNSAATSNTTGVSVIGGAGDAGTRPADFVQVPDVAGMPVDLATQAIEAAGLAPEIILDRNQHAGTKQDTVYTQSPAADSFVAKQSTVDIVVQVAPSVPAVKGLEVNKALQLLKQAGLEATQVNVDAGQPLGTIITQNPKPGQHATGGNVTLVVQQPEDAQPGGPQPAA